MEPVSSSTVAASRRWSEIFRVFLKLGLTSFGGPVAHVGFFRAEFVQRRRWLSEAAYAELLALCHFLPGPASSQVGLAIGYLRAGPVGAFAAWCGFTLPSALLMLAVAVGIPWLQTNPGVLHGLKVAALVVVAQAIGKMARQLCPDVPRIGFAVVAAVVATGFSTPWTAPALIAAGLLAGSRLPLSVPPSTEKFSALRPTVGTNFCLVLFVGLLVLLPWLAGLTHSRWLQLADAFYRTGALVFGGGHIVLPLLEAETGGRGWFSTDDFLAGYGAAQAVPGPLFSVSAYLGALALPQGPGWLAGLWCLGAIFLPSFLLVLGVLPHWEKLRARPALQTALAGANAVVVGLLVAVFVHPLWGETITSPRSLALVVAAGAALILGPLPPWLLVVACAAAGGFFLPR